ncbi:helix-turn-helix domain-containing protein [Streptomyces sp. NPDC058420]|uniref:helix-turn-helix domain-containing protein n=1 Tax=Streptomyces sp. NPDC058420 TaxID=3346489 RepID=UPI003661D02A
MKNSKQPDRSPEGFKEWLHEELTARGYDLSGPRSGGKSRFAEDSGISPSTVGRLLKGDRVTDIEVLTLLANKLGVPLGQVLVRAGILSPDGLASVQNPETGPRRITPEQAANELGITDAQNRRLFVAMTETLQRTPHPKNGEGRAAEQ